MPARIQLSRRKGWRKPPGAVVVSRPSRWGNPFKASDFRGASRRGPGALPVLLFRRALREGRLSVTVADVRRELRGKSLACWCKLGAPCHADVLMEIANR